MTDRTNLMNDVDYVLDLTYGQSIAKRHPSVYGPDIYDHYLRRETRTNRRDPFTYAYDFIQKGDAAYALSLVYSYPQGYDLFWDYATSK